MGQITVTLPPELEQEIEDYLGFKKDSEELSQLVLDALSAYVAKQRSELTIVNPDRPYRYLRLTPAAEGSGASDVSVNHDKYLAEAFFEERQRKG